MKWKLGFGLIFIYLVLCLLTLIYIERPYVLGTGGLRLGADSVSYFEIAKLAHVSIESVTLLSFAGNLLGPVAIAYVLVDPFNVFLFNVALFLISVGVASQIRGVRWLPFVLLLMGDAETLSAIVSLNKEILSLVSLVLFAFYLRQDRRSKSLLFVILLLSLFVRWEQLAIMLIFFALRYFGFLARRPKTSLLLLLVVVSIAYPLILSKNSADLSGFTLQGEEGNSITVLNTIQAHFGYPLVVFPKMLMSIMGRLLSPWYFFQGFPSDGFMDLQNDIVIHLHTLALTLLALYAAACKRLDLRRPLTFFCAIYMLITALSPFVQPRYQYPIYVLLALEVTTLRSVPWWRTVSASSPRLALDAAHAGDSKRS